MSSQTIRRIGELAAAGLRDDEIVTALQTRSLRADAQVRRSRVHAGHQRDPEEARRELASEWETAKEYSAGRGWSAGTLLWWSSRLGREAPPQAVRLTLVRSPTPRDRGEAAGAVVVEMLDARVRVTVERGADREAVVAILELLALQVER